MLCKLEFITTPTADTPGTALILNFPDKRYLLGNAHEGLQRAITERSARLKKLSEVFLTGKTEWKNTGGLIGLLLTLADSANSAAVAAEELEQARIKRAEELERTTGKRKAAEGQNKNVTKDSLDSEKVSLRIHGGSNVTHTLATARRFVFRKGMPVSVDEVTERVDGQDWKPTWEDHNIRFWAMSIDPAGLQPPQSQERGFRRYIESLWHDGKPSGVQIPPVDYEPESTYKDDQQLRKRVLAEMFDSSWQYDGLVEARLSEVKMPASIFVRNPETRKIEPYSGPLPGNELFLEDVSVLVRTAWPGALIENLPPTKPSESAISYIIRNHPQRGKFLPQKALELGVEQGPLWTALSRGNAVPSKTGVMIYPEEVLTETKIGGGAAVLELPSRDYVENLIKRPEWRASQIMDGVGAIIWILGPGVAQDTRLHQFMEEFSHLKHVVSSPDCCPDYIAMNSAASAAIRHHQIDPLRYRIPVHDNLAVPQRGLPKLEEPLPAGFIPARRDLVIQLEPSIAIQSDPAAQILNTADVILQTPTEILSLAAEAWNALAIQPREDASTPEELPSPEAEIVCLGTGSTMPSKYRNVSSTLLRVPGSGSYLLDCGESTLGQLKRVFTKEELSEVLRDLKMIWISHLHADHHLGTLSVIKAWYEEVYAGRAAVQDLNGALPSELGFDAEKLLKEGPRLFVVSEKGMTQWLKEYSGVEEFGYEKLALLDVVPQWVGKTAATRLKWNSEDVSISDSWHGISASKRLAMQAATGLKSLEATFVSHCAGARAVSLTFPTGFKFSYSGDCRPSSAFAEIGKGSTVLLHEATFEDELRGDAIAKKHSTTSEAIGVGAAMGAKRVLLTHFSQRYQKIPVMDNVATQEIELEADVYDNEGLPVDVYDKGTKLAERRNSHNSVVNDSLPRGKPYPTDAARSRGRSRDRSHSPNRATHRPQSRAVSSPTRAQLRDMKVAIAFDYMRVKVKDLEHLEKFTPALVRLYSDAKERDDQEIREDEGEESASAGAKSGKKRQQGQAEQQTAEGQGSKGKKKDRIGGGKMGRVPQSEKQKQALRSGSADLFR